MATIESVGVISFVRFTTILMAFVGLGVGILYSFGGAIIDVMVTRGWITTTETPGLSWGTALAFLALIGMPLIFSATGFVAGIVLALLYNLIAKVFGGIEVRIDQ